MDIEAIRTIAIKSAEQYYNYLDSQETDKRRGETRYNVKKIEHFGDGMVMLTLFSNLNDTSLARIEVNGQQIDDKLYEFISYDNLTRTLELKAAPELCDKMVPGNENNVQVIHDFKFLIDRIKEYLTRHGNLLHFPDKGSMSESDIEIKARMNPNDSQIEAIKSCLTEPSSYVWGAPGTGKTQFVLANSIFNDIKNGKKVAVFAPTNVSVEQVLYGLITEIKQNPEFSKVIDLDKDVLRIGCPTIDFAINFPNMCERKALVKNKKVFKRTIEALEETKNEMIADALEKDFKKLRDLLPTYKEQNDEGKKAIDALFDEIVMKTRELPFTEAASKNASSLDMEHSLDRIIEAAYRRARPRRFMQEYEGFSIEDIDELIKAQMINLRGVSNPKTNSYKARFSKKYKDLGKDVDAEQAKGGARGGASLETAKIIVCTPHQFVNRMVPASVKEERKHSLDVGHIYVDEIGYSNLMNVLPLFTNDCPITFLGDHMQLDLVFTMSRDDAKSNIRNHGDYCLVFLWGMSAINMEDLFFGKNLSNMEQLYIDDRQPEYQHMKLSVLKESYRFGENLARILDRNVYGSIGLSGVSHDGELKIRCNSVEGDKANNCNQAEIEAIEAIAEESIERDSRTAVVLAPYNNQVDELGNVLKGKNVDLMTIHKSQGREWDTVIVSVTDTDPYGRAFMDTRDLRNLKLVNTAVSRAKKYLFIVCDYDSWKGKDDELISKLIDYAAEQGELY